MYERRDPVVCSIVAMRKNFSAITYLCCGLLALAAVISCSPFTAPDRKSSPPALPESFSLGDNIITPEKKWWLIFSSDQLNTFIEEALADNLSLQAYWARIEKVQAQATKAGSAIFPSVSGDASASYSRKEKSSGGASEVQSYSLGLFASYEIDLWGRVRAGTRSADLAALASRDDLDAAAMTVAAEVARRWIGIVASRQQLELLQKQLKINQTYLELIELRFQKSLASALDVMQQKQLVERVRAQIPLLEMQQEVLQNDLAVLTGRMPGELSVISDQTLPLLETAPASGVPVQLLENRPDIQAAFRRLQAADENLVIARADRLPAIRLTGSAGYSSSELDRLFDNWLLNLAASLTAPLFDGGRRKAEVAASNAAVQEQLALYRQEVLTAVREVEEALVREQKIREHIGWTEKQLGASRAALTEARARYVKGLNDYLPVLTQLLSVQNLEMDIVDRHEELLGARITLYRSIGGTWTDALRPPGKIISNPQDEKS